MSLGSFRGTNLREEEDERGGTGREGKRRRGRRKREEEENVRRRRTEANIRQIKVEEVQWRSDIECTSTEDWIEGAGGSAIKTLTGTQ